MRISSPGAQPRAPFRDRTDAGAALALSLGTLATEQDVVVLGLARGGVPIARQVADALGAPMDVLVARKIGVPGIEEVALGAIAEGSDELVADGVARYIGLPPAVMDRLAAHERREIHRRVRLYRDGQAPRDVRGCVVVLVDDGLSTGATLRAAARLVRARGARRVIAAVPVASLQGLKDVRSDVDEVVTVITSRGSQTVSAHYESFAPMTDADVMHVLGRPVVGRPSLLLRHARLSLEAPLGPGERVRPERRLDIPLGRDSIVGDLGMPRDSTDPREAAFGNDPRGLVILVHGAGSSRMSYRNRYLAGRLRLSGWATLRLDLLTYEEQERAAVDARLRFDVSCLAARLTAACEWVRARGLGGAEHMVLFGSSVGAAAALCVASADERIAAVMSRSGRVDLAASALGHVRAPVLLLVGTEDRETLERNREALRRLPRRARLVRIRGAGHTFEEPGALGAVGEHAAAWLEDTLSGRGPAATFGLRRLPIGIPW